MRAQTSIRNPLAKVRGLGSAKNGTHHWLMQRVTAIAMIPLIIWLLGSLTTLLHGDAAAIKEWLSHPFQALLLIFFFAALFYHARLGLQVIIEDYIHCGCFKPLLLLANYFACAGLFGMAAMAIFKLHFG